MSLPETFKRSLRSFTWHALSSPLTYSAFTPAAFIVASVVSTRVDLPIPGSPPISEKAHTYKLTGNSCLAGDQLGDFAFDEPLKVGDRIIFEDMIHYTMVKTTFFNGVRHPSIGKFDENGKFHLLHKFTYEQFKEKL